MEPVFVCYEWRFSISVINSKGKISNGNILYLLGHNYSQAKFSMNNLLKKRRWKLIQINKVTVVRIAFAYYEADGFPDISRDKYPELPIPEIPTQL